ncbi:MAG: hypothetical protein LBJ72_10420 [Dysgonamonadaceae bacterium]|jgi:predicted HAD superfamily hydrolase|nr:hypothetical protein [Dysgonamonadaceae bacterium]
MISEKQYVLDSFRLHFETLAQKKLVIYGIGENTQRILQHFKEHNIVGLMDQARTGEMIYGKKIISEKEVLELGVDTIIIVAKASITRIIFRRIASFCATHSIRVFDFNGKVLGIQKTVEKSFDRYRGMNMATLKERILQADVVSFDVFDTLVMRRVLYPHDIFLIVASKIEGTEYQKQIYAEARVKAERELYNEGKVPDIHEIYDRIQLALEISDEMKILWKDIEIQTEAQYLIPRKSMCEALHFAITASKEVILTSDMYLPEPILRRLLVDLGIKINQTQIFVSCDHGVTKSNGLFDIILRSRAGGKKMLHVGDNHEADERFAKEYGIDDVFPIESALVMLEDSYACELLKYDDTLCNRLMIAEFIGRQLNDAFLFSDTRGKFRVKNNYEVAYSFIAPIIYSFFGWLTAKANELKLEHIFFSARDGFLLDKISKLLHDKIPDFPITHYFYTSRIVASLAGLNSDDDILYFASLPYSGSLKDMLKNRFRLTEDEIEAFGGENLNAYLIEHRDAIMKHSRTVRANYLRYIECLQVKNGSRVGFFDFFSSGTCQKALSHFVDYELYGIYFSRINDNYKADLKIETWLGMGYAYKENYYLLEDYFFMENILTSYEPTLEDFDSHGQPMFAPEHRTKTQIDSLYEMHDAILDYVARDENNIHQVAAMNKKLPDFIFHLLGNTYSVVETDYLITNVVEDRFCNRRFEIPKVGEN